MDHFVWFWVGDFDWVFSQIWLSGLLKTLIFQPCLIIPKTDNVRFGIEWYNPCLVDHRRREWGVKFLSVRPFCQPAGYLINVNSLFSYGLVPYAGVIWDMQSILPDIGNNAHYSRRSSWRATFVNDFLSGSLMASWAKEIIFEKK